MPHVISYQAHKKDRRQLKQLSVKKDSGTLTDDRETYRICSWNFARIKSLSASGMDMQAPERLHLSHKQVFLCRSPQTTTHLCVKVPSADIFSGDKGEKRFENGDLGVSSDFARKLQEIWCVLSALAEHLVT